MRSIIQIAATSEQFAEEDGEMVSYSVLYALAADGTLWQVYPTRAGSDGAWSQMPGLPEAT